MQHESNRASRDTGHGHGNGQADQQQPVGERITWTGRIVPSTVLMTALDNGTLILQGRPDVAKPERRRTTQAGVDSGLSPL